MGQCAILMIFWLLASEAEHLENLDEVFQRSQVHGICMKRNKCLFMQESVQYLGHRLDAEGIRATPEKVAAIMEAPSPTNVQLVKVLFRPVKLLSKVPA